MSQNDKFPEEWQGKWKGELEIYQNSTSLENVTMSLVLLPLSCFRKVAVYFCSDQGAMMEHSHSYVTEEQRRYE